MFAAASLRDALEEVAEAHGGGIVLSFGGSGQIARQVDQGAPAEVILLAHPAWMDWLVERGAVVAANRFDLLGNRLVLIGPAGAPPMADITLEALRERLAGGRMALGQTRGVPAGIYARQWLENAGLWPGLAGHLAEVENVRAALALVARGEAPLGVVYASDAQAGRGVVALYAVPGVLHDPVRYQAALVEGNSTPEAVDFMRFLRSPPSVEIFARHGFAPLGSGS